MTPVLYRCDGELELWTYQPKGFAITEGRTDVSLSQYASGPSGHLYVAACKQLHGFLGTDQILWCTPAPCDIRQFLIGQGEVEWHIRLPPGFEDGVFPCRINGQAWCHVSGQSVAAPKELHFKWRYEALDLFPEDESRRKQYEDEREAEFHAPPRDGWWSHLFADSYDQQILLRFPIREEWVVGIEHAP